MPDGKQDRRIARMFTGENEAAVQRQTLKAALEQAMCAAQGAMEQAESEDIVRIAEWAARGVQVIRWRPPGAPDLRCPLCGQADNWFQSVAHGRVACACQHAA
jgi:hypothetical protein